MQWDHSFGRTTTREALLILQNEGYVSRTGAGKRNDAYRYFISDAVAPVEIIASERILHPNECPDEEIF
jgi:hypothetical protein